MDTYIAINSNLSIHETLWDWGSIRHELKTWGVWGKKKNKTTWLCTFRKYSLISVSEVPCDCEKSLLWDRNNNNALPYSCARLHLTVNRRPNLSPRDCIQATNRHAQCKLKSKDEYRRDFFSPLSQKKKALLTGCASNAMSLSVFKHSLK